MSKSKSKYNDPNRNEEHKGGWTLENKTVLHRGEGDAATETRGTSFTTM